MSDDAFDGGPPERKAVDAGYEIRRNKGTVRWFRRRLRGGDGQVEAVCDACQSDDVDASTCLAASLLDACFPVDVV
ncbi:unnamed protein product [Brassica oleracea]